MRRYITEFIGTFFLVFTIGCTVLGKSDLAPIAIGAALMVMVYAGGHVSGGHYNPAVTLAIFFRGRIAAQEIGPYWGSQILGGVVAAALSVYVTDAGDQIAREFHGREIGAALVAEVLFTFALAYVVLNVATSKSHPDNQFYGLAIGFTVLAGAIAVGAVSGGAFNPSVVVGLMVMGLLSWSTIWIYLLAQVVAAAAAGFLFKFMHPDDE
jgi:aquaporin Z